MIRTRKIKCDETKPSCNRCQRIGTICRYNNIPEPSSSHATIIRKTSLAPLQPRLPTPEALQNPSVALPANEAEYGYFRIFVDRLSSDINGCFASPLWTKLIPQQCFHDPAIRHSIFALSALYKSQSPEKKDDAEQLRKHLNFALVQHSKAIDVFRKRLLEDSCQTKPRCAAQQGMMASLLFGCFESFHGNWQTAFLQISSGLRILAQWNKHRITSPSDTSAESTNEEIGIALFRLQLQMESFLAMNPNNDCYLCAFEDQPKSNPMPTRFRSVHEAFLFAIGLATDEARHIRRAAREKNDPFKHSSLERENDILCARVDHFKKAFRPIFLEVESRADNRSIETLGVLLMNICVLTFDIALATCLIKEESIYDRYTDQFRRLVALCRRTSRAHAEHRAAEGLTLHFGIGSIFCLYFVATRCRDHGIRWEAISLLRQSRGKNGIWDNLRAAAAAQWIVRLEEEHADEKGSIPERWRVRMSSLKLMLIGTRVDVECVQGPENGIHGMAVVRREYLLLS